MSLQEKLARLYKEPVKTDAFGRRQALPAEIQALLSDDFTKLESAYPPTQTDVGGKDDTTRPPKIQRSRP